MRELAPINNMSTPPKPLATRFHEDAGFLSTSVRSKDSGIEGATIWFFAGEYTHGEGHNAPRIEVVLGDERLARRARAAARRERMTIEIVTLGAPKPSPYAASTPDERLAAAVPVFEYQQALRGGPSALPRSEWPGETFVTSYSAATPD